MQEVTTGIECIFPVNDNFQIYITQVLFYMKYLGHFTMAEVYGLPVAFRTRMIEMLIERLEKESGKPAAEGTDGDLNREQEKFLQNKEGLQSLLMSQKAAQTTDNPVFPKSGYTVSSMKKRK